MLLVPLAMLVAVTAAMPANPKPVQWTSPVTSQTYMVRMHGGPSYNYETDDQGFLVRFNKDMKEHVYMHWNSELDQVEQSDRRVSVTDPNDQDDLRPGAWMESDDGRPPSASVVLDEEVPTLVGKVKGLVLLMRFANHKERDLPIVEEYMDVFEEQVLPFLQRNSHGRLNLTVDVVDWVDVDVTESEAAAECNGFCEDSGVVDAISQALQIAQLERNITLSDYSRDGQFVELFTVIHSGMGAEVGGQDMDGTFKEDRIWSHYRRKRGVGFFRSETGPDIVVEKYNINPGVHNPKGDITKLGVLVHEMTHNFGIIDLYDRDGSSKGLDSYTLMANPWGFDGQQNPSSMCGWSKAQLGWVDPVELTKSGVYTLDPVQTTGQVFRISHGYSPHEYLLLENRARIESDTTPQDAEMPSPGGLMIYHIDDTVSDNRNEGIPGKPDWPNAHYKVALVQADGSYDLERNFFPNAGDLFRRDTDIASDDSLATINSYVRMGCGRSGNIIHNINLVGEGANLKVSFTYERMADDDCCTDELPGCPTDAAQCNTAVFNSGCCVCGGGTKRVATPKPFALPWVPTPFPTPSLPPFTTLTLQPTATPSDAASVVAVFAIGGGIAVGVVLVFAGGMFVFYRATARPRRGHPIHLEPRFADRFSTRAVGNPGRLSSENPLAFISAEPVVKAEHLGGEKADTPQDDITNEVV